MNGVLSRMFGLHERDKRGLPKPQDQTSATVAIAAQKNEQAVEQLLGELLKAQDKVRDVQR